MNAARIRPLRVVIAGGGVAALEALLALHRLAEKRVSVEVLSAEPQFWYRPLSVAEPFGRVAVHGLDLSSVAEELGATLTLGRLASVDVEASLVRTHAGAELDYDVLLVATGARAVAAIPGAVTFRGPADTDAVREVVTAAAKARSRIAFAAPGGASWPVPLYELALLAAATTDELSLTLVTSEDEPLGIFGSVASRAIADLLAERGIELVSGVYPVEFSNGALALRPRGSIAAAHVIALPRLEGPQIDGLPHDQHGFIPTDATGRVRGAPSIFAAGDVTTFPIKQGGLATQQADAAAEAIAAVAGAEIVPEPFRPVLRGLILTGASPVFARAELARAGRRFASGTDALWWPPGKIVGKHLAPFLAERSGSILSPPGDGGIPVEVDLPAA